MIERLLKYTHSPQGSNRPTRRTLILVTLAALATTACDNWLTKPSLYGSLSVATTRRDGTPIPGAPLTLYTGPRPMGYAVTDSSGRFTFTSVPQGQYGVIADPPPGYTKPELLVGGQPTNVADNLIVAPDSAPVVRFTFLKEGPGTVVVRVANPDGSAISGVPVTLYGPAGVAGRGTTDAAGRALFTAVPFGVYGVIINRPFLYRDYRTPNDSLYSSRDNLIVEDGSRDSVAFSIRKCAGSIRVLVQDQNGLAVPGTTTAFFTSSQTLGVSVTAADGRATFTQAPCVTQIGVAINPAAGYSAVPGRGTSFVDGLVVTDGATVDVVFRVQRTR